MADDDLELVRSFRFQVLGKLTLGEVPQGAEFFPDLPVETTLGEVYKLLRSRLQERERAFFEAVGLYVPEIGASSARPLTPIVAPPKCLFKVEFVHYITTGRGTVTYAPVEGGESVHYEIGPLRWTTLRLLAKLQLTAADDGWVDVREVTLAKAREKAFTSPREDPLACRRPDQSVLTCIGRLNSKFPPDQPLIEKRRDDSQVRIRREVVSHENLVQLASF